MFYISLFLPDNIWWDNNNCVASGDLAVQGGGDWGPSFGLLRAALLSPLLAVLFLSCKGAQQLEAAPWILLLEVVDAPWVSIQREPFW